MGEIACANCGRTFVPKTGTHRFCRPVCREQYRERTRPPRAKYGGQHQRLRKQLAPAVAAGRATCSRCGDPIEPGEEWDLDHSDDGRGYLGPAHAYCNRAAGASKPLDKYDRAIALNTAGGLLRDDPANGVFWGPPTGTGHQPRWSQVWFEWRDEPACR